MSLSCVVGLALLIQGGAVTKISRFRILAPEFVCPKDEHAVLEKPDSTIITLQTSAEFDLKVEWIVRWKPLVSPSQRFTLMVWKTVRALEAKLNGPQPEPLVYVIDNSEFLSGVDYVFNVSEVEINDELSQVKTFHIDNTQGDQKLMIDGRGDMISIIFVGGQLAHVDLEYILEAQVTACYPTQDYYFIWVVMNEFGENINVPQVDGSRLEIPPNTLKAGATYDVNCSLYKYSDGHIITQTNLPFQVSLRGLEAYFNVDLLVISINYPFNVDAVIFNHDNYEIISLEWQCVYEDEGDCDLYEEIKDKGINFPLGLTRIGRYNITLSIGVLNDVIKTSTVVLTIEPPLPVIQIDPVHRVLNEGTVVSLTANVSNVSPTCTMTWYFASEAHLLSTTYYVVNDSCNDCQYGEPLTETLIIQSLEENFLNELADFSNDTEWRQVSAELPAAPGRARFVVQCGCSLTFGCDRQGVVHADIHFQLNKSPKVGNLMISPDSGSALETVFRISTLPANDPDAPLKYYFYCRIGPEDTLLLASYVEHRAIETILPFVKSGTEVWIEICDMLGACASTEKITVNLHGGEGRTISTLLEDVEAHVRRCEIMALRRVIVSAIVTYKNADQDNLLNEFSTSMLDYFTKIDKGKCQIKNKDQLNDLQYWLQSNGIDINVMS